MTTDNGELVRDLAFFVLLAAWMHVFMRTFGVQYAIFIPLLMLTLLLTPCAVLRWFDRKRKDRDGQDNSKQD